LGGIPFSVSAWFVCIDVLVWVYDGDSCSSSSPGLNNLSPRTTFCCGCLLPCGETVIFVVSSGVRIGRSSVLPCRTFMIFLSLVSWKSYAVKSGNLNSIFPPETFRISGTAVEFFVSLRKRRLSPR